jgi:integration host factor subunit beta
MQSGFQSQRCLNLLNVVATPAYITRTGFELPDSSAGGRRRAPSSEIKDDQPGGRTMTKADLVEEIAATTGVSRNHTAVIMDGMLDAVCRALSEGKHLEIRGFGTFKVRERRARRARNPRSGTEVQVPAKLVPVFKPSKELKAQVLEAAAVTTSDSVA